MKGKKYVYKNISLQEKDKEWLDQKAEQEDMTTNQLIRIIIKNYIEKEK